MAEAAPPRRDADSTRGHHFRRIVRGRAAGYALGLGVVAAFVAGAWVGSPLAMAGGPLAVVALVLAVAWRSASRRAALDFFTTFASTRGLRYVGDVNLPPLTPLLGAGDRRRFTHWMAGPLNGCGLACGFGHYTWYEERASNGHLETPHHCTICVVDLEPGIALFPGVFLARRRGLAALSGDGTFSKQTRRKVELESLDLHERYELWVERSQDDVRLRQLFSPAFVAWLAAHPLAPCFEYRAGALVVYLERRLADAGRLGWLHDAAAHIARRFADEIEQALRGRAA